MDTFEMKEKPENKNIITQRFSSFVKKKNWKVEIRKTIYQRLPITEWLPKYDKISATADIIAGITLGLTLIPQSIAYASLANLTAQYGLYSSFVGTTLYAFFGTVKEVSIGPTSLLAILILHYCKGLPYDYVVLLGFLSGLVIILVGILRLGFLVEFISLPVTSGFTSATATIIIVSQIKGLLGMKFKAESVLDNLMMLIKKYPMMRWPDFILGINCIIFLLTMRKIKDIPVKNARIKKILWFISLSRNGLVVVITALIAYRLEIVGNVPFMLSERVPTNLPAIQLPKFSVTQGNQTVNFFSMCSRLGSGIFVVPLTGLLANIAIAKAFSVNKKVDATQEMLTLGICQLAGSFVQAMPSTGAFTRSAVSHASGVRTPFAGIYSGIMTILALTFLAQYFYYIPRATLSAVLISAVVFMIDFNIIGVMWKGNRWDVFITLITYFVSLLKGVEVGLMVGVIVNLSYLIYLTARPSVEIKRCKTSTGCEYVLVTPEIGLYFLSISFLKDVIIKAATMEAENVLPVVVDCSKFQAIDYSACKGLENLTKDFEARCQRLVFMNVSPKIVAVLEPLTKINPNSYHCTSETEMLEVLYMMKADEVLKMETLPLLSENFRKQDSFDSDHGLYEICDEKDPENKFEHVTGTEKVRVEHSPKEGHIENELHTEKEK